MKIWNFKKKDIIKYIQLIFENTISKKASMKINITFCFINKMRIFMQKKTSTYKYVKYCLNLRLFSFFRVS